MNDTYQIYNTASLSGRMWLIEQSVRQMQQDNDSNNSVRIVDRPWIVVACKLGGLEWYIHTYLDGDASFRHRARSEDPIFPWPPIIHLNFFL